MSSTIQNIIISVGILLIAGLGFYLYSNSNSASLDTTAVNNKTAVDTAVFLQRLTELGQYNLEGKIFTDARFTSLVNTSQAITPLPIGRQNPFAAHN